MLSVRFSEFLFSDLIDEDKNWVNKLKTKAKILTSFYQIVSKLPSTLAVEYPAVYRGFTTAVNSLFNFNTIGLLSVGCFLPRSFYSFYGSFLVMTLTPIGLSLLLLSITLRQKRNLDPYAANNLIASRFSLFYGFTYLIFASTLTMVFTTFLCKRYGDDETWYLPFENHLAKISSVSIFLTLLAAILIQLKENPSSEFSAQLGALLVFVNKLVFAMVGAGILFKPVFKFIKKFNEKHVHDAELKGMGPEIEYPVDLFLDYFKVLADSSEKELGMR
ncbi:hypothetical protein TL16_g12953 [Triparma laevis f. inornata]|uniref:Uncharacterized protein n=1 Tax=Triparma laevis f. inornata TaxID=1714386 RepID=A0A9W7BNN7_9STRA|nr:hypothetical protein TL16_g12953 [Triparma laevis f. inornata]